MTDFAAENRTTLFFLQQRFATCINQIRCETGLNVGGKTCNIAIQLVLQQRCKTSCMFLLPVLLHPKKRRRRRRRQRERQKSRRKSQRSFPRPSRLCISVSYPKEQARQSEGPGNQKFTCDYRLQLTRVEITHFLQNTVKIILAVIKVLFSFS